MMGHVLELALKGRTSPNPKVGCIITKNSKVIAEGYHEQSGQAHAEIIALKKAGKNAKDAIMWINLEPCCHFGKTPPCVEAIKKAGIKEVIIAIKDPNPIVSGKGIKALKKAGIKVNLGFMEKEAFHKNPPFRQRGLAGQHICLRFNGHSQVRSKTHAQDEGHCTEYR